MAVRGLWAARHDEVVAAAAVLGEHRDRGLAEKLAGERLAVQHPPVVAGLGAREQLSDAAMPASAARVATLIPSQLARRLAPAPSSKNR